MNNYMLTFLLLPLLAAAADVPNHQNQSALNGRCFRINGNRVVMLNGQRHVLPVQQRGISVVVERGGNVIQVNQAQGPQTPVTSYRGDVSDSNLSDDGLAPDRA